MSKKITAWSYSRWSCYSECPAKAKFKFVDRLPEPSIPALENGTKVHKEAEDYLKGSSKSVPASLKAMKEHYKALKNAMPAVELELAFDSNWKTVTWFSPAAWCRSKLDAVILPVVDSEEPTVRIIDHKTGKLPIEGKYDDQLELYALVGLKAFPYARRASGELWFVEHNVIAPGAVYARSDEKKLVKKWATRTKSMLSDTVFKPTPGNFCRWCHFRKSNGGPCEY